MNKKLISTVLLLILIITLAGCSQQLQTTFAKSNDIKYTLYIGLNDKDTYKQEISTEEAEKKIEEIALKYVDGFTLTESKGAYKDDNGVITYENSLVYIFNFATEEQIKNIMDEVLRTLNQNSILVEKENVAYDFYEGETE